MLFLMSKEDRICLTNMVLQIYLLQNSLKQILKLANIQMEYHSNSGVNKKTKTTGILNQLSGNRTGVKECNRDLAKLLA